MTSDGTQIALTDEVPGSPMHFCPVGSLYVPCGARIPTHGGVTPDWARVDCEKCLAARPDAPQPAPVPADAVERAAQEAYYTQARAVPWESAATSFRDALNRLREALSARAAGDGAEMDRESLIAGLRRDAGDYARSVRGESFTGSWDQRDVRAWKAAQALAAQGDVPALVVDREALAADLAHDVGLIGLMGDLGGEMRGMVVLRVLELLAARGDAAAPTVTADALSALVTDIARLTGVTEQTVRARYGLSGTPGWAGDDTDGGDGS